MDLRPARLGEASARLAQHLARRYEASPVDAARPEPLPFTLAQRFTLPPPRSVLVSVTDDRSADVALSPHAVADRVYEQMRQELQQARERGAHAHGRSQFARRR